MKLKTTVLKASPKLAQSIKSDLLALRTKKGNCTFREFEIENGFELRGKTRNESGDVVEVVVFRYTDKPAPRIDYDSKLVTI